eukprot:c32493_g1_i1.p1 GENE.c32493_g1_i1~~c32493_g1_i1.p1  ORF type:complete len:678 (+),score=112.70 c32493_g1_i1:45-2078(+)
MGVLFGVLCFAASIALGDAVPFQSNFEDDALVEVSGSNVVPGAGLPQDPHSYLIQSSQATVLPEEAEPSDEDDGPIDMQLKKSYKPSETPAQLAAEMKMPFKPARSDDGRADMRPSKSLPFDSDCDSPQLGESEAWPNKAQVDMNEVPKSDMGTEQHETMAEQPDSTREFPLDKNSTHPTEDDPAALKGVETMKPDDFNEPQETEDVSLRTESLPEPPAAIQNKTKCSRSHNAHDVPDPLEVMDDDCGMPEPEIPCETAGNSTLCPRDKIELRVPEVPEAELMPPTHGVQNHEPLAPLTTRISVEFVDFGVTSQVVTHISNTVGRVIEKAGSQFDVDAWAAQLVRNMGADVKLDTHIQDLADQKQIVVYLRCTYERFKSFLIVDIPACEDLIVQRLVAKVEVPAFNSLYTVPVLSTARVGDVIGASEVDPETIARITYDGQRVDLETPLEEIFFRNNSALVVYPKEPCQSESSTPSATPTARPSFSPSSSITPIPSPSISALPRVHKVRKLGAYDAYRHCRNANGEKPRPPPPEALGLDPLTDPNDMAGNSTFNCDESEMTEPEIVEYAPQPSASTKPSPIARPSDRAPMTKDAKILVDIDHRLIPVLIHPTAKGIDIFDAVKRATGREHEYMIGIFLNRKIDHYTPLKPFGLIDNDVVKVVSPVVPLDDNNVGANV